MQLNDALLKTLPANYARRHIECIGIEEIAGVAVKKEEDRNLSINEKTP
jgi:hypothetical protein